MTFWRPRAVFLMFLKCYIFVKQNTQLVYFKKHIFDLLYSCKYPLQVAWVVQALKEPCEIQPPIERELRVVNWESYSMMGTIKHIVHYHSLKQLAPRRHCLFQTIRGGLWRGNPHVRCAHVSHRLVRTSSLWIPTCRTSLKRQSYTQTLVWQSWSNLCLKFNA